MSTARQSAPRGRSGQRFIGRCPERRVSPICYRLPEKAFIPENPIKINLAAVCTERPFVPVIRIFGEARFRNDLAAILARQRRCFAILKQVKDEGVSDVHLAESVGCQARMIKIDGRRRLLGRSAAFDSAVGPDRCDSIKAAPGGEPDFTIFGIAKEKHRRHSTFDAFSTDFSDLSPVGGWFDSSR
ncbi:hypothetical protein [Paraburkholderia youngii]|uniref:hypothetical protein n=1 Tax=Paraburkholderia youngii TaxID=2782701 RepID=UPI003D2170F2